jgi:hypothetical protein
LVVPQVGDGAGTELRFVAIDPIQLSCADWGAQELILADYWNSLRLDATVAGLKCSHTTPHLFLVVLSISSWFDRPIGYLWAVVPETNTDRTTMALDCCAKLVALSGRGEAAARALKLLATPVWEAASNTRTFASSVARTCKDALFAAAVIIWELNPRTASLTTIAAVRDGADDTDPLRVDMQLGQGIAGHSAQDNAAIVIDDILDETELKRKHCANPEHPEIVMRERWRSAVFVPLDIGGRIAGVMATYSHRPRAFSQLGSAQEPLPTPGFASVVTSNPAIIEGHFKTGQWAAART